eukprot:Anaeramoba_ignava/a224789_24.p1 GENE.a224789_24~~a224789_24.p1  ORF type:complete len:166 (-),score=36.23 a224789_24:67-564(-)
MFQNTELYLQQQKRKQSIGNKSVSYCMTIICIGAFIGPSLGVAYKDKDIGCSKPLWNWILVCNIVFAVSLFSSIIIPNSWAKFKIGFPIILNLFLLAWSIIGIVWATKCKDECGKLYEVALGDSITVLVLMSLTFFVICCCVVCCLPLINDINAIGDNSSEGFMR